MKNSWSLYDQDKDQQYDNLTLKSVQSMFRDIKLEEISHWYAWNPDYTDWQPVIECHELEESVDSFIGKSPMSFEESTMEIELEKFDQEIIELREQRRYNRNLLIQSKTPGVGYISTTTNISLGGVKVERELPVNLRSGTFVFEISWGKKRVTILAKPIQGSSNQLEVLDIDSLEIYRSFLLS